MCGVQSPGKGRKASVFSQQDNVQAWMDADQAQVLTNWPYTDHCTASHIDTESNHACFMFANL